LDAAAYYCDYTYFDTFSKGMQIFDKYDANSVKITQMLIDDPTIKNDLIFNKARIGFLVDKITSLENKASYLF